MKKYIVLICLILSALLPCFAQIKLVEPETKETQIPEIPSFKAGGFLEFLPVVGNLREYQKDNIGVGFCCEMDFKLPFYNLQAGPVLHWAYDYGIMNGDKLKSMKTMSYCFGGVVRIPVLDFGLIIAPEVDYGVVYYFPESNKDYFGTECLDAIYCNQLLQIAAGVKYAPPMICNGKLEFEFTPVYQLTPGQGSSMHSIGFRTGVMIIFY